MYVYKAHIDLIKIEVRPAHYTSYLIEPRERQCAVVVMSRLLPMKSIGLTTTEWSATIVFVLENDGSLHFFVKYRKLNVVKIRDLCYLLRIDEYIDRLGEVVLF